MAVPTTLHIGRPCMQCTPSRVRGPGGAGLLPCRGLGEEGGGGRGEGDARILLGGGGGKGGGEGRGGGRQGGGGGAGASARPHARQQSAGGMATNLVHSA